MTVVAPSGGDPFGSRAAFWVGGLALAAVAHAGALAMALRVPQAPLAAPEAAPPAMLELVPVPAAPPSPQTAIADSLDRPEPMADVEMPSPLDDPPTAEPPQVDVPVVDTPPEIETLPDLRASELAVPPPLHRPQTKTARKEPGKKAKPEQKPAPSPPVASRGAAPEIVSARGSTLTPALWQSRLMAHLERRKRYPGAAQARGEEGTVEIRFSIDDRGNVLSARVVRSSGHPALDAAVVALLHRASPVPAPPPDAPRTITAPVRFDIR